MNKSNEGFSVLVCSCDGCADILDTFFKLLKKYWPELESEIVLSTETLYYQNPAFSIRNVHPENKNCSWTERILDATLKCSSEQILIILDDFFLYGKVNDEKVRKTAEWLRNDTKIATFTYWPLHHLSKPSKYVGFCERTKFSKSKVAMITGMWNKAWLVKYLSLVQESAWKFEIVGNEMSRTMRQPGKFFALIDSQDEIFPYAFTLGLTSGKWIPGTEEIFRKNNIKMDFQKRGFIEPQFNPLGQALIKAFKMNSRVFTGKRFVAPKLVKGGGEFEQEYYLRGCKNCVRWIIADLPGFSLKNLKIIITYRNGYSEIVDSKLLAGTYKKLNNQYIFNGHTPYIFICSKNNMSIRKLKISGKITYPATKEQLAQGYMIYTEPENKTVQKYIDKNDRQFSISSEAIGETMMKPEVDFIGKAGQKTIKQLASNINGKFRYEIEIPKNTQEIIFRPSKNDANWIVYHSTIYLKVRNGRARKKWSKLFLLPNPEQKYLIKCCKNYNILIITGRMTKPAPRTLLKMLGLASRLKHAIIR